MNKHTPAPWHVGIGNGEGIKRTCKALGIKYTYSSIKSYLKG